MRQRSTRRIARKNRMALKRAAAKIIDGYRPLLFAFGSFLAIAILVYLIVGYNPWLTQLLWLSRDRPWGIITSMFLHVEPDHLTNNVQALLGVSLVFCSVVYVYPTPIRKKWSGTFAALFFFSGALANAIEYVLLFHGRNIHSWGASGMVYGVMGVLLAAALTSSGDQIKRLATEKKSGDHRGDSAIDFAERGLCVISLVFLVFVLSQLFLGTGEFFGEAPNIDLTAHVLGFLIGFVGACVWWGIEIAPKTLKRSSRPR